MRNFTYWDLLGRLQIRNFSYWELLGRLVRLQIRTLHIGSFLKGLK